MINISTYGTKDKTGGTIIKGGTSGTANPFKPVYLWGQYFDDTEDIDGDMQVNGTVTADAVVTKNMKADKLDVKDLKAESIEADAANIKDIEAENMKAAKAEFAAAVIKELGVENAVLENLTVTKAAHFFELIIDKIKSAGGALLLTPADGFNIDKVEEKTDRYRLYFKSTDGEKSIHNMWQANDQAICQNFNDAKVGKTYDVSNKYWWSLVLSTNNEDLGGATVDVNFGTEEEPSTVPCHYIEISKNDKDGIVNPEEGDSVVMLGNRSEDSQRQTAIYIAAYASIDKDLKAPLFAQYRGINDFTLDEHKYTWFAAGVTAFGQVKGLQANEIRGNFKISDGTSIEDYLDGVDSTTYKLMPNNTQITIDKMGIAYPTNITCLIIKSKKGNVEELDAVPEMMKAEVIGTKGSTDTTVTTIAAGNAISVISSSVQTYDYISIVLKATTNNTIYDRCPINISVDNSGATIRGGHYEFAWCVSTTKPATIPAGTTKEELPAGWSSTMRQNNYQLDEILWMSQCWVDGNNTYGEWSEPVRMTGEDGKPGNDGKMIEFIYSVTSNNQPNVEPTPPTISYANWNGLTPSDNEFIPRYWTDNPTGVTAYDQIEWVATRTNVTGQWSEFSSPAIWSKWGERGMDGDGYEYIFKNGLEYGTHPKYITTPASESVGRTKDEDDFTPLGWSDEPVELTQEDLYVWVSMRKKTSGTWGDFTDPQIWAHWSSAGSDGSTWVFAFKKSKTKPTKPATGQAPDNTWTLNDIAALTDAEYNEGYIIWMTQCEKKKGLVYQEWTDPIKFSGIPGKNGEDGTKIEYIYKTSINKPTKPAYSATGDFQNDDYLGPSNNLWSDNPTDIDETNKTCWVCVREKDNGKWGAFSEPVIWSQWGEKGMDGDGYEYIFYRTDDINFSTNPTPSNYATSSNYQADDYFPSDEHWTDEPQEVSISVGCKYVFVSMRKKRDGKWGAFTDPKLWSRYSSQGDDGGRYIFLYCNHKVTTSSPAPTKPNNSYTIDSITSTSLWKLSVDSPDVANGYATFMTYRFVSGANVYDSAGWSTPIRITGENGRDGEDGTKLEFIYKTTTTSSRPSVPTYSNSGDFQNDDYVGTSGWTDNPTGVDETNKFEWVATREKKNGKWGSFSQAALWSKYGEKGMDGDGYEYVYLRLDAKPSSTPTIKTDDTYNSKTKNDDEYLPYSTISGTKTRWTDDPSGITPTKQIEYVSVRKKHNGTWGNFSTPAIWAQYIDNSSSGIDGNDGNDGKDAKIDRIIDNGSYAMIQYNSSNSRYTLDWKIDIYIYHYEGTLTEVGPSTSPTKFSDYRVKYRYDNVNSLNTVNLPSDNSRITKEVTGETYNMTDGNTYNRKALIVELQNSSNKILDRLVIPVILRSQAIHEIIQGETAAIISTVTGSVTENIQGSLDGITNSISTLQQTAQGLTSTVEGHTTTIDTLSGQVSGMSSSISEIRQKADNINLTVADGLKRSGIDINAGCITLNSVNTNVVGDLNLYQSNQGLSVWNSGKTKAAQIRTSELGVLNNYGFAGIKTFDGIKTGSKSATTSGSYFEVTIESSLGSIPSGTRLTFNGAYCNIDEKNGQFISIGNDRTVTKIEYSGKLANSSNVARYTFTSGTTNTPTSTTRNFLGHFIGTSGTYTTPNNEVLKVQITLKIYVKGNACNAGSYSISYSGTYLSDASSTNYICPDGIMFGADKDQYLWGGNYKSASSRNNNDWGFVVRNKQQNFAVTPLGIFRTYYNHNSSSDSAYNNILGNSDLWGDIGSTLPVYKTSTALNLSTTKQDGCRLIDKIGLFVFDNSSAIDLTLPLPSTCAGKTLWLRARGGGQVRIKCSSSVIMDDDTNNKNNQLNMPGNKSCIMVSDGDYWIWFRTAHNWDDMT